MLACAWLAISYVELAHARRGRRTAFVAFARKFGFPPVKRTVGLLGVGAELFPVAAHTGIASHTRRPPGANCRPLSSSPHLLRPAKP